MRTSILTVIIILLVILCIILYFIHKKVRNMKELITDNRYEVNSVKDALQKVATSVMFEKPPRQAPPSHNIVPERFMNQKNIVPSPQEVLEVPETIEKKDIIPVEKKAPLMAEPSLPKETTAAEATSANTAAQEEESEESDVETESDLDISDSEAEEEKAEVTVVSAKAQ